MAKSRTRKQKVKTEFIPHVDATPERLAKGDHWEMVNPAEIDDSEQRNVLTRRFRSSTIDRLHKNGRLSWVQWYAADQYRNAYHRAAFTVSVVASYGERTSAGEVSYGLARTESQARARDFVRFCRASIPADLRGFMERLIIHDQMPKYGVSKAMGTIKDIHRALDKLACELRLI